MHIDPKAPATSAQHPRNWRKPLFLAPGAYTMDETPPATVQQPPAEPATPPKAAPKKTAKKRPDLAEALAKLDSE